MCVYINKDNRVSVSKYINCTPVASHINAPLAVSVARKRMIIEKRMKWSFFKNKKALLKLAANFGWNLFITFLKMLMKLYFHRVLRYLLASPALEKVGERFFPSSASF